MKDPDNEILRLILQRNQDIIKVLMDFNNELLYYVNNQPVDNPIGFYIDPKEYDLEQMEEE